MYKQLLWILLVSFGSFQSIGCTSIEKRNAKHSPIPTSQNDGSQTRELQRSTSVASLQPQAVPEASVWPSEVRVAAAYDASNGESSRESNPVSWPAGQLVLEESSPSDAPVARIAQSIQEVRNDTVAQYTEPVLLNTDASRIAERPADNAIQLNLPSALALVDRSHPVVGFAQWRVQEAYAQVSAARALWLPSLQAGFSFHRHDGNYQASNGQIVDVDRNSFQYGLGTNATGAGTTPLPGILSQFHLADALFRPKVAKRNAWALGHAAQTAKNEQLLEAGLSYVDLVGAFQNRMIVLDARQRLVELSQITRDFAEAGEGLQSDAERLSTEVSLIQSRVYQAEEQASVASARLIRALSLDGVEAVEPLDFNALPIELTQETHDKGSLIATALSTRTELKESQALVAAACEAYQQQQVAPFVPSVLLGFSTGGFGGGLNNNLANVDDRYDFDAALTWRVRNLGFGEKAARRESASRVQQAKFEKLQVMDEIAAQVNESASQVEFRRQQIDASQKAIASAQKSFERNLDRIHEGEGLPIEALQSTQALETAHAAYLQAVVAFNRAQLRLQWALGWPLEGLTLP